MALQQRRASLRKHVLITCSALGLAAFLLAGCGTPQPSSQGERKAEPQVATAPAPAPGAAATTGQPDFALTLEKKEVTFADVSVPAAVTIKLTAQGGFDLSKLTFRAEGLPDFITADFGQVTASGNEGSVVVQFRITKTDAERADYPVKITAEGEGVSHTETITVKVVKLQC